MGHIRTGVLPKSQKWNDIVQQIAGSDVSEIEVADIAQNTIQNVRSQFRHIVRDNGVIAAFQFLVHLAVASREENPQTWLLNIGIKLPANPTPLSFAQAVNTWVEPQRDAIEYSEIAHKAAGDAISKWYREHLPTTGSLFQSLEDPFEVWRKAANGAGFCELSRLFFAKFTQRYLSYFLDREASSALGDFSQQLERHVDTISLHAFETAKINQSYAAGWFNKFAKEGVPHDKEIGRFVEFALGKMRDALQQEDDKK